MKFSNEDWKNWRASWRVSVIQIAFFVFVNQSLLKQNFFRNEDRDQKLAGFLRCRKNLLCN
jgi:hypothetical protein